MKFPFPSWSTSFASPEVSDLKATHASPFLVDFEIGLPGTAAVIPRQEREIARRC